jgi:hypothetical protein
MPFLSRPFIMEGEILLGRNEKTSGFHIKWD